jgi:hypothetical protein
MPVNLVQLAFVRRQNIRLTENYFPRRCWYQPNYAPCHGRFAAAALADQPKRATLPNAETYTVNCLDETGSPAQQTFFYRIPGL